MPLTGEFHVVELTKIIVPREERQRRELTGIEDLAKSIKQVGLINPLVLTRDGTLVAGERRLEALKLLEVTWVQVQYLDELDPHERRVVELEENIKRKALKWQEYNKSIYDYHNLKLRQAEAEKKPWTIPDTARELSISPDSVDQHLWVRREINGGNASAAEALKFTAALAICQRAFEREATSELDLVHVLASEGQRELEDTLDIDESLSGQVTQSPSHTFSRRWSIETLNWREQAKSYEGERFNFVHFDPPYGVNRHTSTYSDAASTAWEQTYEDTEEEFFNHLDTFVDFQQRLCQSSCHLMLWFSMNYYGEILEKLFDAEWRVVPHPLIWNKVSTGIASDPKRRPRHVYETALFASLGDRPIIRPFPDVVSFQPTRDREHFSEKPVEMLEGFFKMCVDGSTRMLDPTCGSASALRVALALGARSVVGWELDPQVAQSATNLMRNLT